LSDHHRIVARGKDAWQARVNRPQLVLEDMANNQRMLMAEVRYAASNCDMSNYARKLLINSLEHAEHTLAMIETFPRSDGPDIATTHEDWVDEPLPIGLAIGSMSEDPARRFQDTGEDQF